MIKIENLSVSVDEKSILHNLSIQMAPGTIHVLMGPNGSGKSTLAQTLMGHPRYHVTQGSISLSDREYTAASPDARARAGFFLAFQQPLEIPGVSLFTLLKEAHRAVSQQEMSVKAFQELLQEKMAVLQIEDSFAKRPLNEGCSGGEKKRIEILQMLMLNPQFVILDEIDSGLDVDAVKIVAQGIHKMRELNPSVSLLIITHYPRILQYITPDYVHILMNGTIVKSGDSSLVQRVEQRGYDEFCS